MRIDPNYVAVIAMALNGAAYTIEIVRAGIVGINKGQWEAGYALGMSSTQIYRDIIMPQALKIVFAPLGSQFILIMLMSSVVSVIAATELSAVAADVSGRTFRAFEAYIVVTLIYLGLAVFFSLCFAGIYRAVFVRRAPR